MEVSWNPSVALIVAVAGAVLLGLIYFFGQPKRADQGRRLFARKPAPTRREPSLEGDEEALSAEDIEAELASLERMLATEGAAPSGEHDARAAPPPDFEKIVSLHVAARDGETLHGTDLVVAAEKAGLHYGAMNIFHRSVDGRPGQPPIFSVANMLKPGTFDLRQLDQVQTPGISFFMTLPGPLSGLDAWDAMLPAAQRMAELLDAAVLDDRRNALGRQRIAHLRDELRAWDRQREQASVGKSPPW